MVDEYTGGGRDDVKVVRWNTWDLLFMEVIDLLGRRFRREGKIYRGGMSTAVARNVNPW